MLKEIVIKGRAYSVKRIEKIIMEAGIVKIWYCTNALYGSTRIVEAPFRHVEFVSE